jgi:hypothetical protein
MHLPITDLDAYVATRTAWHTLAERVLAPARHAATGRIGLRSAPGGFATPSFGADRVLAVGGTELTITDGHTTRRHAISTLGAAAALVGVDLGIETGVYTPTTSADPGAALVVDPANATALGDWIAFGQRVLDGWRAAHPQDSPSEIQLWPEHFDLALDLGPESGRANYGASPGDGGHELPYLYVGPWNPTDNEFWNAGTYARLGAAELVVSADPEAMAREFFTQGYAVAGAPPKS